MSADKALIADSVRQQQHLYALDILSKEVFRRVEVYKLLIYFIDTVDEAVLPFLAEEFDVLGVKGWDFAITAEQKRKLLKGAIELHRYKGTPWAVMQSLIRCRFVNPVLVEHTTHWARFKITLDIDQNPIDVTQLDLATRLVLEYKNARSHFDGFIFSGNSLDFGDSVTVDEELLINESPAAFNETVGTNQAFYYDGTVAYDGSHNYSQETDTITINII